MPIYEFECLNCSERFDRLANGKVVNSPHQIVPKGAEIASRFERQADGQPLCHSAFFVRHADVQEEFEPGDVDGVWHVERAGRLLPQAGLGA